MFTGGKRCGVTGWFAGVPLAAELSEFDGAAAELAAAAVVAASAASAVAAAAPVAAAASVTSVAPVADSEEATTSSAAGELVVCPSAARLEGSGGMSQPVTGSLGSKPSKQAPSWPTSQPFSRRQPMRAVTVAARPARPGGS